MATLIDRMARLVAARTSRRRAVAGATGGLIAVVLSGGPRVGAAGAVCQQPGRPCGPKYHCCRAGTCAGGTCACPAGEFNCGGECVFLGNDERHCGACDNACDPGETCLTGRCAAPAPNDEFAPRDPAGDVDDGLDLPNQAG